MEAGKPRLFPHWWNGASNYGCLRELLGGANEEVCVTWHILEVPVSARGITVVGVQGALTLLGQLDGQVGEEAGRRDPERGGWSLRQCRRMEVV